MPVSNPGPLLQHSLVRYQRATTVHSFAGWDVKLFICLYTNYDDVKSLDGHILQHQNTLIKAVVFTYLSDSLYTAKKNLKYIFKNLQKSNEKIYLENIVFRSRLPGLLLVKHCNFNWFLPVTIVVLPSPLNYCTSIVPRLPNIFKWRAFFALHRGDRASQG